MGQEQGLEFGILVDTLHQGGQLGPAGLQMGTSARPPRDDGRQQVQRTRPRATVVGGWRRELVGKQVPQPVQPRPRTLAQAQLRRLGRARQPALRVVVDANGGVAVGRDVDQPAQGLGALCRAGWQQARRRELQAQMDEDSGTLRQDRAVVELQRRDLTQRVHPQQFVKPRAGLPGGRHHAAERLRAAQQRGFHRSRARAVGTKERPHATECSQRSRHGFAATIASMSQPLLILASTSRYRRELLERLRLPFEVVAPQVDETPLPGEQPAALAQRLALAKAHAVALQRPDAVVIGSDQVADLDGEPIGKPGTHERAVVQLQRMRGRRVTFQTAVAVVRADRAYARVQLAPVGVSFRALGDAEIEHYLRTEQPYDCAGSAKCETLGIALLTAIDSDDPTALVGLPLIRTCAMLREAGLDPLSP